MFVNSPLLKLPYLQVLFLYLTDQVVDDTLPSFISTYLHKGPFRARERNPRDPIVAYTYTTTSSFLPSASPSAKIGSFGFLITNLLMATFNSERKIVLVLFLLILQGRNHNNT